MVAIDELRAVRQNLKRKLKMIALTDIAKVAQ